MRRAWPALLLLLVGCSAPDSGTVYERRHHSAYVYISWMCTSYDKNGFCMVRIPITHHVPERWELCLDDGDDRGCRGVDRATHDQYQVGEFYPGE